MHIRTVYIFITLLTVSLWAKPNDSTAVLYQQLALKGKLSLPIFKKAVTGFEKLQKNKQLPNKSLLTIIDFTQPSTKKRLFLISLKEKKVVFNTYVAHGKNTGGNYAKQFSNTEGSLQSSLGFYRTLSTYHGKHGYSLKLKGLEKGINDNAESRAIVMHGADYVSASFINKYGRLGRSWGCPALPQDVKKEIINTIKNGTCLFIYADDSSYIEGSTFLEN